MPGPQMRREPLPIVAAAGFLLLHPAFGEPYTFAELLNGRLTETVKGVNAFWRFLAAIFLFMLCLELFGPPCRRRWRSSVWRPASSFSSPDLASSTGCIRSCPRRR